MIIKNIIGITIVIILLKSILPVSSYPQTNIGKATREVDKDLRKEAEKKLLPAPKEKPQIEKEKKKKKEKLKAVKFFVKEIKLEGVKTFLPRDFEPIVEKYENKEGSLEQLDSLAKEIEREYLRKGVIAACFVPPQKIKNGIVILQVIEAKMGNLEIEKHRYFKKNRLRYYWQLKNNQTMRYDKIRRSLQIMNKNPDRKVKAALHAGKKPETTDVLLDVKTRFPVHLIASLDNEGITSTGKQRNTLGIRHNNFLGLDDSLLQGYMWGNDFSAAYVYHSIPINNSGTSLMYGYSYSKSFPKKEYEPYGIDARSKNSSFFIHQDIFKKEKYLGETYLGIESKDKTTKLITGTFTHDRLRTITAGGDFIMRGFGSITYIQPEFSQGINGLGAKRQNEFSSRKAKNTFSKFNLSLTHKRAIPFNWEAVLKLKAQLASTRLSPQEEFSLGGAGSVRGYPAGDYLADNAVQTNLEILIPSSFFLEKTSFPFLKKHIEEATTFLLFFDYGYGRKRGVLSGERKSASLAGLGLGLRIRLFNQIILKLAWGFPVADETITEKGHSRFHFSFDFESKTPYH